MIMIQDITLHDIVTSHLATIHINNKVTLLDKASNSWRYPPISRARRDYRDHPHNGAHQRNQDHTVQDLQLRDTRHLNQHPNIVAPSQPYLFLSRLTWHRVLTFQRRCEAKKRLN